MATGGVSSRSDGVSSRSFDGGNGDAGGVGSPLADLGIDVMEMIFSDDPTSEVFLGTLSSQDAELPLHQAVSYGSVDAVKRLLRKGVWI